MENAVEKINTNDKIELAQNSSENIILLEESK